MVWSGDVQFSVQDGAAGVVSVPSQTVQAVIGCCSSGTVGQVVPTRSLSTLTSTLGYGPLVEAAGLVIQAGGTVLAVKATSTTAGSVNNAAQSATNISGVSIVATNARITTTAQTPHVLQTGDVVTIAGVVGSTEVNGTWVITVVDATHFEVPVTVITPYVSGGTVQFTGAVSGGGASAAVGSFAGTAAPYFTGTPVDDGYVQVVAQVGFTVGTTGGTVLVSLDGGRNYGSPIPVGTSLTLSLKDVGGMDSGLVLHLGGSGKTWTGGGVVNGKPVGDFVRCSTVGPQPNDAGVQSALSSLVTYLAGSGGAFPIVQVVMNAAASDASAVESGGSMNLDAMASQYLFERAIMSWRDAKAPTGWGGAGETEATWLAAAVADIASTTAKRVCLTGGHYNMPSAFPTSFAGTPSYRRPFSFALAARQVQIQPQTHAGRVGGTLGGPLSQIVRNAATDSADGFIYHDEYLTPSLDYFLPAGVGRFATARTHPRKLGFFASNPLTLAQNGSDFALLPAALVMDVACTIAYNTLINYSAADFQTKPNGTLKDSTANRIKGDVSEAIQQGMSAVAMISGFSVQVDQTTNVQVSKILTVTITIQGVAYILQINVPIGFSSTLAASAAA